MAEQRGRPKTLVRRHVLEIKKDTRDWIVDQFETFTDKRKFGKTSRIIGAGFAAAGIYVMVRILNKFGRNVLDAATEVVGGLLPEGVTEDPTGALLQVGRGPTGLIGDFFASLFGATVNKKEEQEKTAVHLDVVGTLTDLGGWDPFAFGAALTAGGMVLAGQNPGEILKGIGSIIDALIPL